MALSHELGVWRRQDLPRVGESLVLGFPFPAAFRLVQHPAQDIPATTRLLATSAILWSQVGCIPSHLPCVGSRSHAKLSPQKLCKAPPAPIPHFLDPQSFLLPLPVLRWSQVSWPRAGCWESEQLIPRPPAGEAEGLFPLGSALSSIPWTRGGLATPSAEMLSLPVIL